MNDTETTVIKWTKWGPGYYTARIGPHYFVAWRATRPERGQTDQWHLTHNGPNGYSYTQYRFDHDDELDQLPTLRECKHQALRVVTGSIGWENELVLTEYEIATVNLT